MKPSEHVWADGWDAASSLLGAHHCYNCWVVGHALIEAGVIQQSTSGNVWLCPGVSLEHAHRIARMLAEA